MQQMLQRVRLLVWLLVLLVLRPVPPMLLKVLPLVLPNPLRTSRLKGPVLYPQPRMQQRMQSLREPELELLLVLELELMQLEDLLQQPI
jgi:hypothetical protein